MSPDIVDDNHDSKKVKVLDLNGYHIITIKKNKMDFSVSEGVGKDFDFYVNSNFFTAERKPTCGVVIDGKTNKPNIVFNKVSNVEYLSQTHVWVIKNKNINNRMLNMNHAKKKVCRLLIGKNKNGEITIVHSNKGNKITMRELTNFALNNGVIDAFILDSGPSVEVFVKDGSYVYDFKSVNDRQKSIVGIPKPVIYITGNFK
jgi:exopolysaccharide biosynthesis protein